MMRSSSPSLGADLAEEVLEILDDVDALRDGEHEPFVDRAEEGEAVVGVDLLDCADMVLAADPHHERMGGEGARRQGSRFRADDPRVLEGGRLAVDLHDDAVRRIGLRDDDLSPGLQEMLGLERAEASRRRDQKQRRGVADETAVMEHEGAAEVEVVARRAADERRVAERVRHGAHQLLLAYREAVDEKEGEALGRRGGSPERDARRAVAFGDGGARLLGGRPDLEVRKIVEEHGRDREILAREADAADAARDIAERRDLPAVVQP